MNLLEAKNLSHAFDYELFNDISITLSKGESVAIVGRSGSGKSTILHILSTLLKPNGGKVFYKGKDIYSLNDKELLAIRRYEMGIIFQSHYLFKGFTGFENIKIASLISQKPIYRSLLRRLGIENTLKKNVGDLSGGQQQRISIARVLVKSPTIIFADEPTGNLDKETAEDVMNVLFSYIYEKEGAMLLVTHDEELAKKCSRAYRLKDKTLNLM
ncbi:MAG: ABC transporter ATP-binding protein [Epsilonproteobacteria bacterium]|nr:ABC transporter ATP-binding protein [Campylobacterota bacterium]